MANTEPVADTAGVVEQVWRLGREAGYCDVYPVGAVTVGPRRRAARRARRDGRLRRPGAGLLRRRQVRERRRADAPGAGVRQGVRRRHRPARPGAPAHRGRPDERGRALRAARARRAGRRSPRRRSSPATACSPRTSAPGCTSATSRRPVGARSSATPRRKGWNVTAEACPHHLLLTDELAATYDPIYKVNPPLRTSADVEALRAGLADGTIDVVATDHAPHPHEDKDCEWAAAAFGMLGLETALSIVQEAMVDTGLLDWAGVAERMSYAPARIGRVSDHGQPIEVGAPANVVLYDPSVRRDVEASQSASLSRNTPYAGMELPGRVVATFLRGRADGAGRQAAVTACPGRARRRGRRGRAGRAASPGWCGCTSPARWCCTGLRPRRPRARGADDRRHPHRGRQRCQDVHRADGAALVEDGVARRSTPGRGTCSAPTCRSSTTPSRSSTCCATGRGSATTSTRTLIEDFTTFVLPVPVITLDSAESYLGDPRRLSAEVPAGNRLLLLQRRLLHPGRARRAGGGRAVPRPGPAPGDRAGRADPHGVPPQRRAARATPPSATSTVPTTRTRCAPTC